MKCILFRSLANKQWYFHFVARNGKLIWASEGYRRQAAAHKTAKAILSMGTLVPIILEGDR